MSTFVYSATNNEGEISGGELEMNDVRAVIDYLNHQDLTVISVKQKSGLGNKFNISLFEGLSIAEKIMLTKHLSTIVKAGLTLREGIETILNDAKKKTFKKILTEAKLNLEKGQPLSVTFKKYPKIFSGIFIALIETGEASGTLEKSLDYLGEQLKKEYSLKQKIKSAMIYPLILLLASFAVITILMVLVVPRLTKAFMQNNLELPWSTKLIINASSFITGNLLYLVILFALAIISFLVLRKNSGVQNVVSEVIIKIPVVSDLYEKIILARFTRTLGTLLSSGINILKAIDISSEVLGHNRYQKAIKDIKTQVTQGVSIGNALKRNKNIFPYLVISMVNVGEKTGKLDSILKELAVFYEEEIDNSLKNLVSLLEPALLLFMGVIVATIAFSVIMPIYQMVGSMN